MKGCNLHKLIKKYNRNFDYRCLVECIFDHEMTPGDPLTPFILKGAKGIAYYFWYWNNSWWNPGLSVSWDNKYSGGDSCNYFEKYRRWNKIRKPITEIKFVKEIGLDFVLPEKNPLIIHPSEKEIKKYFKKI